MSKATGGGSDTVLIRNVHLVSMDTRIGNRDGADIRIVDGRIAEIGAGLNAGEGTAVIDGKGKIAIPGFVDSHRHTWQALLRNSGTDWSRGQYVTGARLAAGDHYTPDDMYIANLCGALEALDGGITTLCDWSHNCNSPEHTDAAVAALFEAGGRAIFAYGGSTADWLPISDRRTDFGDVERLRRDRLGSQSALVTMAFASRGPEVSTLAVVREDFTRARELGLRITMHAGCGLWGSRRKPVEQLAKMNLLGSDVTYVHCNMLSDHELDLVAESGATASLAPEVELNMGHGNPATLRLLERGIRPSISVDTCMSVGGDIFTQMRMLLAAARGMQHAAAAASEAIADELCVNAHDVLEFATLQGAKACGLEDRVGSISVGKDGDIVLLSGDSLNMFPVNDPVNAVVSSAGRGDVDTVIVRGRTVKSAGRLTGVDIDALRRKCCDARDDLFARFGVTPGQRWVPGKYVTREPEAEAASSCRCGQIECRD